MTAKRVILIRHAKAARALPGQPDFDRSLTPRGHQQCRQLRAWLARRLESYSADVRVSPARRTRETAERVLDAKLRANLNLETRLWNAGLGHLCAVLEEAGGDVLLVGHNPGLESLQQKLTGQLLPLPTGAAFDLQCDAGQRWRLIARFQPDSDST